MSRVSWQGGGFGGQKGAWNDGGPGGNLGVRTRWEFHPEFTALTSGTGLNYSLSGFGAPQAGDLLVLALAAGYGGGNVYSVTDSAGNIYNNHQSQIFSGYLIDLYVAIARDNSALTISITSTAFTAACAILGVFRGADPTLPLILGAGASGNDASPLSGSIFGPFPGYLYVSAVEFHGVAPSGVNLPPPFTAVDVQAPSGIVPGCELAFYGDVYPLPAGTYETFWSLPDGPNHWNAVIKAVAPAP